MIGQNKGFFGKKLAVLFLLVFLSLSAAGCGEWDENTRLVLTTGFKKDEIFRIETMSCTLPEALVYLTNIQEQYESVYGKEIWETDLNGVTLEENVKETVLAQLAQVKTMNLLAASHGVSLDDEEMGMVQAAAQAYYSSLNDAEIRSMRVTEQTIEHLYAEFALANKVYEYIIKDINPEISDDEARTITVQHILIKTYTLDEAGNKISYTGEAREDAKRRAREVLELAREEGSDFEELVLTYSEGDPGTWSFGKGEMGAEFEHIAFNLETGEISDVIETEAGYHILKCISTFNREETDANKIKIVEKRRKEVFGQEYDVFVSTLARTLNESLWERVTLIRDDEVKTKDFFDIYNQYFS